MAGTTGGTVHMHYCMGKLKSIDLFNKDEGVCSKCCIVKSTKKGCCKDEQKTIKTNDHQQAKVCSEHAQPQYAVTPDTCYYRYLAVAYKGSIAATAKAHAPPFRRNCPIYIALRNIRV